MPLQWFAAIYTGLIAATYCCLLINAFVGFQWAEDGTPKSLWGLRIACLAVFGVAFFFAIATFKGFAGMSYDKATALWIIYLLWPLVCVPIYIISQLILVFRTLEDRWPIGDIIFGTAFWVIGMVILFAFSTTICNAIKHYIDGLFFSELCVLLSVMMVYKYWDSITVRLFHLYFFLASAHLQIERRSRVLCRQQVRRLGGQGPSPCWAAGFLRRGQQLSRSGWSRHGCIACWRCQWTAILRTTEERRRSLPTSGWVLRMSAMFYIHGLAFSFPYTIILMTRSLQGFL